MKKFEIPEIEIEKFEIADVITTSNVCDADLSSGCENDTEWG